MPELQKFKLTMRTITKPKTLNKILRLYHPKLLAQGYEAKICPACNTNIVNRTSFEFCGRACQKRKKERDKSAMTMKLPDMSNMWREMLGGGMYGFMNGNFFGLGIEPKPDPLDANEIHED